MEPQSLRPRRDINSMVEYVKNIILFLKFLKYQKREHDRKMGQEPQSTSDFYIGHIEDLFSNMKVLTQYPIRPQILDSLLKFNQAFKKLKLFQGAAFDNGNYHKAAMNLETLFYGHGQLSTFRHGKPIDAQGAPIPWITYPALEFLKQFDYSNASIFEFGSGNSTLFWAAKAKRVVSVETDREWFSYVTGEKPDNVTLHFQDRLEDFINVILQYEAKFDVVMVDSIKYRYDAIENAVSQLKEGGFIVFDNSDWYPNCCNLLRSYGFDQFDYHGFGPVNNYTWTTSIFVKGKIGLARISDDLTPIGGIVVKNDDDSSRKARSCTNSGENRLD